MNSDSAPRMAVRRAGAGPDLVLFHGGMGSWKHWIRNIDALAARFTVHALDHPSYGDSAPVPRETTGAQYLDLVHTLLSDALPGAADVVRILTTLTQQDKAADPAMKPGVVIADERSNSLLIGGDKSERQKLLDIISQLDVPLTEDGATQVVYLRYASAENLAPILEGYAQQADAAAIDQRIRTEDAGIDLADGPG